MTRIPSISKQIALRESALLAALLLLQACLSDAPTFGPNPDPYPFRGHYSITVPNSSQPVHLDSGLRISWNANPQTVGTLSVLLHGDSGSLVLATSVPDTGGLFIDLRGFRLPRNDRFRVKLVDALDTNRWDFSRSFHIVPNATGRIYFSEPVPGTIASIESTLTFRIPFPPEAASQMKFELLKDWMPVYEIRPGRVGDGSMEFGWYIEGSRVGSGDGYRIKASSTDADQTYAGYSPPFSIRSEYSGGYRVSGRPAGDTLHAGETDTVYWSKLGNPGKNSQLYGLYADGNLVLPLHADIRADFGSDTSSASVVWQVPHSLASSSRYRLGVRSLSDISIGSFSDEFTILGVQPDAFEPDDGMDRAREIVPGEPPQQRTATYADADWMRFMADPGKRYGVLVLDSEETVAFLHAAGDGDESFRLSPRFRVFTPSYPGAFFLEVRSSGARAMEVYSGRYSVYLHAWDTAQSSSLIPFSAPGPDDTAHAGENRAVSWTPDTNLFGAAVNADLYRDSTWMRALARSVPNSGALSWVVDSGFASSSRFRVRISRPDIPELNAFSPHFTVLAAAPDAYEPDDARGESGRIGIDTAPQTRNLTASDTDWVEFDCRQGTAYAVRIESGFPLSLAAYPGGTTSHVNHGVSPVLRFESMGGPCLIQVSGSGTGDYNLSVSSGSDP